MLMRKENKDRHIIKFNRINKFANFYITGTLIIVLAFWLYSFTCWLLLPATFIPPFIGWEYIFYSILYLLSVIPIHWYRQLLKYRAAEIERKRRYRSW